MIDSKTSKIIKTYVTGVDGKFIFNVPSGTYTISAVKADYEPIYTRSFHVKSLSKFGEITIRLKHWDKNHLDIPKSSP